MSEQLVPQIRVAGFDGEWVDLPFNQMAHRRSSIVPAKGLPQLEYEDIESGFGRLNKDLRDKTSQKNGIRFERGDVLFGKLRPYLKNWFLPDFEGLAVGDFWVLAPDTCTGSYLYGLIQAPRFTVASSISSGSKMPRSDWPFVSQTSFASPVSREEQDSVGSTFLRLERLVNEHRQKHRRLQQAKASLMQRMFPAPGETEPEIRLGGFTGDWPGRELGDLGHAIAGFGFPNVEQGGRVGTPFYKVSDMNLPGNSRRMTTANNYVTKDQIERLSWRPVSDVPAIIFAKVGAAIFLGRKRIADRPFLIDNNMMAFGIGHRQLDVAFARTVFERLNLSSLVQVGALPSFNPPALESLTVSIPATVAEQQAIGAFFAKLDDLIEAEVQYVSKLQQVKSALLQKMFV